MCITVTKVLSGDGSSGLDARANKFVVNNNSNKFVGRSRGFTFDLSDERLCVVTCDWLSYVSLAV